MFQRAIVALAALTMISGCETPKKRFPASEYNGTTLAGIRVNPVVYQLAPEWEVRIHNGISNEWGVGDLNTTKFKLGKDDGLRGFHKYITDLRNENEAEAKAKGKKKGFLPKAAANAIDEIHELTSLLISRPLSQQDRNDALMHIAELTDAFNHNFKYPISRKVWIGKAPFKIRNEMSNPVMASDRGAASNIVASAGQDASKIDPLPSSFWKDAGPIASQNLYFGNGRRSLPRINQVCEYDEPKDGFGVNGGFSMKCGNDKWKIKFGTETKVEPFNSRFISALGYNAIPVDFVTGIRVKYTRDLLKEYNSRKELSMRIRSLFGFTYYRVDLQLKLDPFSDAILGAYLKNGQFVASADLKKNLLRDQSMNSEANDANYNAAYESQIESFVLREGCIEPTLAKNEKNLGPWNWNTLDHMKRRETRAFGIVAAYLNLYDTRHDNNRLRVVTDSAGNKHLKHYVSDIGSGLGNGKDFRQYQDGDVNQYPWTFIQKKVNRQGEAEFDVLGYNAILENKAFRTADINDARWIGRKIASFSEQQLIDALIAAGWSAAEVKLYTEKLISRRDNLVVALGLQSEFPLLRPNGVNRNFNYDPRTDVKSLSVGSGTYTPAPTGNTRIVNGMIVAN